MSRAPALRRLAARGLASASTRPPTTPAAAADALAASFGEAPVDPAQKAGRVAAVFSSVAAKYDVMNDIMSVGMHRLWKDDFVDTLGDPVAGTRHLDLAGGTGDVAFRVLKRLRSADAAAADASRPGEAPPPTSTVTVCDINADMLAEGRRKAEEGGIAGPDLAFVQADAQTFAPFPDASFDVVTIAFGIRNVTRVDAALRSARRVLAPGGHFACLEFSNVDAPVLKAVYDAYSYRAIPALGQAVAGDAESYRYLVESIRQFPDRATFAAMLREAGFRGVRYEGWTGGVVAVHHGFAV